jgi:DNA-binding CsgD family transcriptional regulator
MNGASPARLMAETMASLKRLGVADRGVFDGILRATLERHPRYLGVWTVWEPDALDGRDREFANRAGHDETGRYVPFWNRGCGSIRVEPNVLYETPGIGEFYLRPRREGRTAVIDPYDYPVAGERRLIASQAAPIFYEGRWVGAAGIDIAVEEVPAASRGEHEENPVEALLERGFVFLDGVGRVSYWSPWSRRLLAKYLGAVSQRELPARLEAALETGAVTFQHHRSELVVRAFDHPCTGPGLLLLEQSVAGARSLSPRERNVLDWMSEGKTNAEIAAILGISLHTVKRHVEKILQKLGAPNRSAAILRAVGPSTYRPAPGDRLAC